MKTLRTLSRDSEEYSHVGSFVEEELSEEGRFVSEDEYRADYYEHPDFDYEWNNGHLEEKPMTDYKGYTAYQWFVLLLNQFLTQFPIAKTIGLEFGFRLELPYKTSIRKPDLGVVLNSNPIPLGDDDFSYDGTFDLCVESLSHSSSKEVRRDTVDKKKEYEGIGVKEYYILDARGRKTAFYRLDRQGKYRKIKPVRKEIIRSEVLPGFQFGISDLLSRPSLKEMAENEIYQSYVLPFYQLERRRAEDAEKRAEYLARKLKELGFEI